jgi:hypothetical protein
MSKIVLPTSLLWISFVTQQYRCFWVLCLKLGAIVVDPPPRPPPLCHLVILSRTCHVLFEWPLSLVVLQNDGV